MPAVGHSALNDELEALDHKIELLLANASARMSGHVETKDQVSRLPKLTKSTSFTKPYISQISGVAHADHGRLVPQEMKRVCEIRKVEDPIQIKLDKEKTFEARLGAFPAILRAHYFHSYSDTFIQLKRSHTNHVYHADAVQALKATAGSDWYNLPKTNLTPQLKKDLQLLHMRNVLDPKRHFKSQGKKFKVPEFSQVGTIIEGPTEFYSARIAKRDRSQSLAAGLLADKSSKNRFKTKYGEFQKTKTSGKKAFYKKQQAKRKKP